MRSAGSRRARLVGIAILFLLTAAAVVWYLGPGGYVVVSIFVLAGLMSGAILTWHRR